MKPKLIFVGGSKSGSEVDLGLGETTIGRNPARNVVFDPDEQLVSGDHAVIRFENGQYVLRDEGSLNGTFINGERVVEHTLQHGDVVDFGLGGPSARFVGPEEAMLATAPLRPGGTMTRMLQDAREAARGGGGRVGNTQVMKEFGRLVYERSSKRMRRAVISLGVVAAIAIGAVIVWEERQKGQLEWAIHNLETTSSAALERLEAQADSSEVAFAQQMAQMQESSAEIQRELSESEAALARLQRRAGVDQTQIDALRARIDGLREQQNERVAFQEIANANRAGVVFLFSQSVLVKGSERIPTMYAGWGTGFIVDDAGHVVTNKHVALGHLFENPMASADVEQSLNYWCQVDFLKSAGFTMTYEISAWRGGEPMRAQVDMDPDPSLGSPMRVVATAPDEMFSSADWRAMTSSQDLPDGLDRIPMTFPDGEGGQVEHLCILSDKVHKVSGNNDLAILSGLPGPYTSLEFAAEEPVMLDAAMVYGYPQGPSLMEGTEAMPQVSIGVIRKVEETIQVDASIIGGNSGGPLFTTDGKVVGITSRIQGEETFGQAIKASYAQELLRTIGGG